MIWIPLKSLLLFCMYLKVTLPNCEQQCTVMRGIHSNCFICHAKDRKKRLYWLRIFLPLQTYPPKFVIQEQVLTSVVQAPFACTVPVEEDWQWHIPLSMNRTKRSGPCWSVSPRHCFTIKWTVVVVARIEVEEGHYLEAVFLGRSIQHGVSLGPERLSVLQPCAGVGRHPAAASVCCLEKGDL